MPGAGVVLVALIPGTSPVGRVDRDPASDRARDAGAELLVQRLLLLAEEHVAMVDDTLGLCAANAPAG
jgi:hypothetical protein